MDHQYAKTNPISFEKWNVQKLQGYLKERSVTYSKCSKKSLVELCVLASNNRLEEDPYCWKDDAKRDIQQKLIIDGKTIQHPDTLVGQSNISLLFRTNVCVFVDFCYVECFFRSPTERNPP